MQIAPYVYHEGKGERGDWTMGGDRTGEIGGKGGGMVTKGGTKD